jgi:2,4-dienoyl-CoA reductase (NADPH2)
MSATTQAVRYPLLAESLDLGPRAMRNRIVQAPMSVCYGAPDGAVTPKMIEHYERRAAGGAGMVITENLAVSPLGRQLPRQALVSDECQLPGLTMLAQAIQRHGALAVLQIAHAGRYAGPWEEYEAQRRLAPSAVEFELLPGRRVVPSEITVEEIGEVVEQFVSATLLARQAGFDGIEVHGAQGMLLASFHSPRMNLRDDRYGQDRNLLAREVVAAVRAAAGDDMLVGYHLFSDEMIDGGWEPADAVLLARQLDELGIHFVIPIPTTFESLRSRRLASPDVDPTAYSPSLARDLAASIRTPVFANGGLGDAATAEAVLAVGDARAVAVARALFADPDWASKSLAGTPARRCSCTPPTCLQTQRDGGICHDWPAEVRQRGYWGMQDMPTVQLERQL